MIPRKQIFRQNSLSWNKKKNIESANTLVKYIFFNFDIYEKIGCQNLMTTMCHISLNFLPILIPLTQKNALSQITLTCEIFSLALLVYIK